MSNSLPMPGNPASGESLADLPAKRSRGRLGTLWKWLRWPLALLVLGWLFFQHRGEFAQLGDRPVDRPWLYLAFGLCLASIVSTYVRWYLLVWAQDFDFSLKDALRIGFLGYLFNYVSPGAIGGDVAKAVFLAREQSSRRLIAVGTVVVDRLIGLLALFLVGAAAALAATPMSRLAEMKAIGSSFALFGIGGTAGLLLLMSPAFVRSRWLKLLTRIPKVGRLLGEAINALLLYSHRWRVILLVLVISLAGHVAMLASFYCCARGIHVAGDIPGLWEHFQFIPAAELAGVFVPLPAGVGALEGAIAHFYKIGGASFGDGVLTGVVYRIISLLIAAVGALVYATMQRDMRDALTSAEPDQSSESAVATRTVA